MDTMTKLTMKKITFSAGDFDHHTDVVV